MDSGDEAAAPDSGVIGLDEADAVRSEGAAPAADAPVVDYFEPAETIESRPSGEFVDGYLAGFASLNTMVSAAGGRAARGRFFYSFDWIGGYDEPREDVLDAVFGGEGEMDEPAIRVEPVDEWRREIARLGGRWLARRLRGDDDSPALPRALAREFLELMEAHLGEAEIDAFRVQIGGDPPGAQDRLLLETEEGRFLLEFAVEMETERDAELRTDPPDERPGRRSGDESLDAA